MIKGQRVGLLAITASVIALACVNASFSQIRGGCKRETLVMQTNQFLSALEANDPSGLPLDPGLKFTENGNKHSVGEGLWKTAGKMLMKRSVVDSVECSTHTQAVLEENGRAIIYGVRLKYDKKNISEIESFVAREGDFAFNAKGLLETKGQDWEGIIPIEERSSRLAMIAAANDYFEMFRKKPSVQVHFAIPCDRWENGTLTTSKSTIGTPLSKSPGHQCSPTGLVTLSHKPRRFLVDREAGVVVAYVLFSSALPDFHMFKMRNGKVELIQAVIGSGSSTMGWPDEPVCIQ